MKSEDFFETLKGETAKIYKGQPYRRKNVPAAAIKVLDRHHVQDQATRMPLFHRICSALGKSGGKTTAARRKQIPLPF